MSQQTITINGTEYDVHTGMPLGPAKEEQVTVLAPVEDKARGRAVSSSHAIHQAAQKSQTLNRRTVKRVDSLRKPSLERPRTHIEKSPAISKFAPHPTGSLQPARRMSDIGPVSHPMAHHANQQLAARKRQAAAIAPKPAQVIKKEAEAEALRIAPSHQKAAHETHKAKRRLPRFASLTSAALSLLLLGGYFTYLNMPNLSVRVAAAQAGINASYPSYRPDGYSLNGPVAYDQGKVSMKFASTGGPANFTVTQSATNWDSSAVKDNYVTPNWGEDTMQYAERGLTIYTHEGNAVWVNGGILYTISGDAPLSPSQIRGIATSM